MARNKWTRQCTHYMRIGWGGERTLWHTPKTFFSPPPNFSLIISVHVPLFTVPLFIYIIHTVAVVVRVVGEDLSQDPLLITLFCPNPCCHLHTQTHYTCTCRINLPLPFSLSHMHIHIHTHNTHVTTTYIGFTTPCNSSSEKRKSIATTELVVVWSVCNVCTSVTATYSHVLFNTFP